MLRFNKITYRIGARVLLDEAEATVNPGHRVGLVGRNGAGKTTLLRLITGEIGPAEGSIDLPSRWRIGMTAQEAPAGDISLIETVMAADRELTDLNAEAATATDPARIAEIHERLRDREAHTATSRAARILAGLGFDEAAQQRPCKDFSGGWRMRVALAALLFTEPDLLLLDEPTNHLDLEATLWLEEFLRHYRGTVLLVSHDRHLLNRVVGEILHLNQGKLTLYTGGYDRFEQARRMRLELDAKLRVKQEAQRAHIQAFVDRFRYKASKAKQAQSRLKQLERMEPIPEAQGERTVTFDFPEPARLAPPLLTLEGVVAGYDDKPVLNNLDLRLDDDDRIALLGANGNGKSTLIKLLAGRLNPLAGRQNKSGKLRIGYFAQHQTDELNPDGTPLTAVAERRPRDTEQQWRGHLGFFGFGEERAETKIADLSGGEKARLLFALMSCDKPHILLLDEPTNHLDVESRQALVQAINGFNGAVVIVSHDPHVIETTADRFWLVDNGGVTTYDGDLDDYRALLLSRERKETAPRDSDNNDRKQQRREAAEKRQALAPLKKKITSAENAVLRLEEEKNQLHTAMADPKLYETDSNKLIDLQRKLGHVQKELAEAEAVWMQLQEELEQAQSA
jgi:ATP-binding cassette subfamily F protein 3